MKEMSYPYFTNKNHITNLAMVKEVKLVDFKEIGIINELIKDNWIYITVQKDSLLLGRI